MKKHFIFSLFLLLGSFYGKAQFAINIDNSDGVCDVWVAVYARNTPPAPGDCDIRIDFQIPAGTVFTSIDFGDATTKTECIGVIDPSGIIGVGSAPPIGGFAFTRVEMQWVDCPPPWHPYAPCVSCGEAFGSMVCGALNSYGSTVTFPIVPGGDLYIDRY